ncbi:UNVERIFIED_CONTAM: single-stranded DNA-binding protein, partial [Escherichia coli]
DEGKYFTDFSFIKPYKNGEGIINKPIPKTEKQKAEEKSNSQQTPMTSQDNPFGNNDPLGYEDDLAF